MSRLADIHTRVLTALTGLALIGLAVAVVVEVVAKLFSSLTGLDVTELLARCAASAVAGAGALTVPTVHSPFTLGDFTVNAAVSEPVSVWPGVVEPISVAVDTVADLVRYVLPLRSRDQWASLRRPCHRGQSPGHRRPRGRIRRRH